jgi:hypothetical protein
LTDIEVFPSLNYPTHANTLRVTHNSGCRHSFIGFVWGDGSSLRIRDPSLSPRITLSFHELMFDAFYTLTTGLMPPFLTNWTAKDICCPRCAPPPRPL